MSTPATRHRDDIRAPEGIREMARFCQHSRIITKRQQNLADRMRTGDSPVSSPPWLPFWLRVRLPASKLYRIIAAPKWRPPQFPSCLENCSLRLPLRFKFQLLLFFFVKSVHFCTKGNQTGDVVESMKIWQMCHHTWRQLFRDIHTEGVSVVMGGLQIKSDDAWCFTATSCTR